MSPPPAIAPDFKIVASGTDPLPGRCESSFVAARMARVLGGFNAGRAVGVARLFVPTADFEPYNGRPQGSYRAKGRAAIASVVRIRHRAGDGWTAFRLTTPVGLSGTRGTGVFGLSLRVRAGGVAFEQA